MKEKDDVCLQCFRPANHPRRRIVNGEYVEGCISAYHTGHLIEGTESYKWHWRKEAQEIRRKTRNDFDPKTGHWYKKGKP